MIGTLRREWLDHVIVLGEQRLRRILRRYLEYYHSSRTHLALDKDAMDKAARGFRTYFRTYKQRLFVEALSATLAP